MILSLLGPRAGSEAVIICTRLHARSLLTKIHFRVSLDSGGDKRQPEINLRSHDKARSHYSDTYPPYREMPIDIARKPKRQAFERLIVSHTHAHDYSFFLYMNYWCIKSCKKKGSAVHYVSMSTHKVFNLDFG